MLRGCCQGMGWSWFFLSPQVWWRSPHLRSKPCCAGSFSMMPKRNELEGSRERCQSADRRKAEREPCVSSTDTTKWLCPTPQLGFGVSDAEDT